MKNRYFLLITLLFFLACSRIKEEAIIRTSLDSRLMRVMADSIVLDNFVLINSRLNASPMVQTYDVGVISAFSDSTTKKIVDFNGISINNRALPKLSDSCFKLFYSDSAALVSEGRSFPGTTISVKVTGMSSGDTLTQDIYMPEDILSSVANFPDHIINTANNLNLTWVPDYSNSSGVVFIDVYYYSALSRSYDPSLPGDINTLSYTVADDGSHTISATDLQNFPANSYIGIEIGRGSVVEMPLPLSNKNVYAIAVSSAKSTPILVEYVPPITISGYNSQGSNYNVKFTNTVTSAVYTFTLNSSTYSPATLGQIPVGVYNILFYPAGTPVSGTFSVNGSTQSGTGANFLNVNVNSSTTVSLY